VVTPFAVTVVVLFVLAIVLKRSKGLLALTP
jgi:hypothetical protein